MYGSLRTPIVATRHVLPQSMAAAARLCLVVLVIAGMSSTPVWGTTSPSHDSISTRSQRVLATYCGDCHAQGQSEGGLAIDKLDFERPARDAAAWEKVIRKLAHRHMPPEGSPRPDEASYAAVAAELSGVLDRAAAEAPHPGRVPPLRRLTRSEYQNVIRDLLAVEIDAASLLPPDETSHGFDNITVGDLSPSLLEAYLAAAKKIVALALGRHHGEPARVTLTVPIELTQEAHLDGLPLGTRGGAVFRHNVPVDGEYEIRLRLMRDRNERVEGLARRHELTLLVDGAPVKNFVIEPPPRPRDDHDKVDAHLAVRLPLTAGSRELSATFTHSTSALSESDRQPTLARFNMDRHPRAQPALYSLSIVGPFNAEPRSETASRKLIFNSYPTSRGEEEPCAASVLSRLARRAYRRPVDDTDLNPLLDFFRQANEEGGFESGIELALRALLVSPHFLFRIERDNVIAADTFRRLSDVELASRLSFFLWSGMPDEELLAAAERGELTDATTLERQIHRMLADERSKSLVENFAAQWLYLRNLDLARPDARLFPDFDENLRRSMRRETELLLADVMRQDLPITVLLSADHTFLDERLARHYSIPGVFGSRFRRVELADTDHRGGLLTHASILTITSYANRTSPVLRGKWVLTNILGTPPNPPPPDVPQLKESGAVGQTLSVRERLAEHRRNTTCATCHATLDPIGFALDHYDAIGRWRTNEEGSPIDATGALLDGTRFDGAADLQSAILDRPDLFAATLAEKLLTFALGRGLDYHDAPAVRDIVRAAAERDYRFSAMVVALARSAPFQFRSSR